MELPARAVVHIHERRTADDPLDYYTPVLACCKPNPNPGPYNQRDNCQDF